MTTSSPFMTRVIALFATTILLAPSQAAADLVLSSVHYSYGNPRNSGGAPLSSGQIATGSDGGTFEGATWASSYSAWGRGTSGSQQVDYTLSAGSGGDGTLNSHFGFGGAIDVLSSVRYNATSGSEVYYASTNGFLQIHLGVGDSLFYDLTMDVSGFIPGPESWGAYYERDFRNANLTAAGDYHVNLDTPWARVFDIYALNPRISEIDTSFNISITVYHTTQSALSDPTTVTIDPGVSLSGAGAVPEPSSLATAAAGAVLLGLYAARRAAR